MWFLVGLWVATAVLAYALRPKPRGTGAVSPLSIEDAQVPTAEAGRTIPVLFGIRKISSPNVVWYGDLDTEPIVKCESAK